MIGCIPCWKSMDQHTKVTCLYKLINIIILVIIFAKDYLSIAICHGHKEILEAPGWFQDSLDQCPMPINVDQNSSIDPNVDQFRSMPINSDQCRLIGIERNWSELIGIDRQWSALRDISDQCHDFDRHWLALVGIGHWSRGVLWFATNSRYQKQFPHIYDYTWIYRALSHNKARLTSYRKGIIWSIQSGCRNKSFYTSFTNVPCKGNLGQYWASGFEFKWQVAFFLYGDHGSPV